uniref:Uncharacterized protein n=1 Tax=Helicotheca tamesis TaxID=374047 RepID=A0A7S2HGR1_9STRA|mmetsp:Transcript_17960/g.24732  ORF Transcript_17960/g.24732 Transcript_17960/m.24732 type:complete len:655 (+) Transcript_17960:89-2053(+)
MGSLIGTLFLAINKTLHWIFQNITPAWWRWRPSVLGAIPILVHRNILDRENLYPAAEDPPRKGDTIPLVPPTGRPDDGYGTDVLHPTTAAEGSSIGRNCTAVPKSQRMPSADPPVQLVAQRLLARETFTPAGDQLNIIAAAWIQAMVHDWVDHYESEKEEVLDRGEEFGCPMKKFKIFKTKERSAEGDFNSRRTMWWDASFAYGNNTEQVKEARTFQGGQLKTNPTLPDTLPQRPDSTNVVGDHKNSWIGVSLLQELFLKEHNYIAGKIAKRNPKMSDEELFQATRCVIAALVAKIHTVDWTVELLKTRMLDIGMKTNWFGLFKGIGHIFGLLPLPALFRKIGKKKADNKGVPFCLTEEFAAVYRLHPLIPPGLVVETKTGKEKFFPFEKLFGDEGRKTIRDSECAPAQLWESVLKYPCGNLSASNYPDTLRKLTPSDERGKNLPASANIDLAAVDLYRDRERGINTFNNIRRDLSMKPYKTWHALTGEKGFDKDGRDKKTGKICNWKKLEHVYGAAPEGIEKLDLLVGDLYEKKIPNFAISETSFIIFLLMASRRLDADPFLNEYMTAEYYTQWGLDHVEKTSGLKDLLARHYPDLAKPFPKNHSAFKPLSGPEAWTKAIDSGIVDSDFKTIWEQTKQENDAYFEGVLSKKII